MKMSPFTLTISLILSSLLLHAALGDMIICENLGTEKCAFSVSETGKRCVLETESVAGEYRCRTSEVEVDVDTVEVSHVETDECIEACGVQRRTLGISSDALLEPGFASKLCSPACFDSCPNIVDLYFNLAAGEGAFLPELCEAHRANPHRSMLEILSSGATSDALAPSPWSP